MENPIVIFGAGTIGCFLGGHWANAGVPIVLLGRAKIVDTLRRQGLILSGKPDVTLTADQITATTHSEILAQAALIVVTTKSGALPDVIASLAEHASTQTPILCLLNGTTPVQTLRAALPNHSILAGMVPFNAIWETPNQLRRSAIGNVIVAPSPATKSLATQTANSPALVELSDEITSIQYGKLLLNLNNSVNALSGKTLFDQLSDKNYRAVYAAALSEALHVLDVAGIPHQKTGPLGPKAIIKILHSPNWLFNTLALRVQKIDKTSQTSMAVDLAAGRETEIDTINGEIVGIASAQGLAAPINQILCDLIHMAQYGGQKTFSGPDLLSIVTAQN